MSKLTHIWIVEGATGEYEDYREWPICAYRTEAKAKRHAALALARANELQSDHHSDDIPDKANEYDPRMEVDGGLIYRCYPVEIRSKVSPL